MQYVSSAFTPLGEVLLASDGEALTGLWFRGQKYFARTLDPACAERSLPVFERANQWLDCYFSGREPDFSLPLNPAGTEFQKRVWRVLLTIPYGETMTYGAIAKRIAAERGLAHLSAQAVGGAVGRNPVSIIIPCHRVVGADGSLTGYAGGIDRKQKLLELEQNGKGGARFPENGMSP